MEIELSWRVRPGRECRFCGEMRRAFMEKATGKPDNHSTRCKRCSALKTRDSARANPDRERQRQQRWVSENAERVSVRMRRWREANADRIREKAAQYRRDNSDRISEYRRKGLVRARQRARNQQRRAARASGERFLDVDIFERDGYVCYLCGRVTEMELPTHSPLRTVLEHRTPLSRGGAHSLDNCATACWECNARKGAKTEEEYKEAVRWATNQSAA